MKKILLYDIENSPDVVYTWPGKMYDQNIIKVIKPWELLSIAYKWLGEKEVYCISKQDQKTDKQLITAFQKVIGQADIVVAHNGLAFDNKKIRAKCLQHGLKPFSPIKTVDTLKFSQSTFGLTSHRLNDLATYLGLGEKVKHSGFEMWEAVMANEPTAWKEMIRYNKHDVVLLEQVYLKMRPWMDKHPHASVAEMACPKCGDDRLQARGHRVTVQGTYARYQCQGCGGWCQGKKVLAKGVSTVKNIG